MPFDTFERILPALAKTELVFLQGWGEPLLNPDFLKMVRAAKAAGCKVGTSTNGTLLDSSMAHRLAECGADVVAVSLAGVGEANDSIRKGASLEKALEAIRVLGRARKNLGTELPGAHVAYMLLRSGLKDVVRLPAMLRGLGVSQVVISTLDLVPCKELENETIVPSDSREYDELCDLLDSVKEGGARLDIDVHYQIRKPESRRTVCTENAGRAMFVSADGAVSPCVFTNIPVREEAELYRGSKRPYRRLTFGNVNSASLEEIGRRDEYDAFIRSFRDGGAPEACEGCPKLAIG
jgi:MoaA/NifB/PqqE/SkfB family radical SAM enzyme